MGTESIRNITNTSEFQRTAMLGAALLVVQEAVDHADPDTLQLSHITESMVFERMEPIIPGGFKVFARHEVAGNALHQVSFEALGARSQYEEGKPPRNRSLSIGVVKDTKRVVVSYAKGTENELGNHGDTDEYIERRLNGNLQVLLHGAIGAVQHEGKSLRVIRVFAMHPNDIEANGGLKEMRRGYNEKNEAHKRGFIEPENYITDDLAQSLIHTMHADRVELVTAPVSRSTYRLSLKTQAMHNIYRYDMRTGD